jgi:enolase-phosphatase E1
VEILLSWARQDAKVAALKDAQGHIWREALRAGELEAHFYPDVAPALRRWTAFGLRVYVFSSASVEAQRAWFYHCPGGSLAPCLSGYFDTRSAGPKKEAASYSAIADSVGAAGQSLLFLSDVAAELDAAAAVGWRTVLVRREEARDQRGWHTEVSSFAEVSLSGPAATQWEKRTWGRSLSARRAGGC